MPKRLVVFYENTPDSKSRESSRGVASDPYKWDGTRRVKDPKVRPIHPAPIFLPLRPTPIKAWNPSANVGSVSEE